MKLEGMEAALRISAEAEDRVADMIVTMCEGEPPIVRSMVWSMLAARLMFCVGAGECFVLPSLDDC